MLIRVMINGVSLEAEGFSYCRRKPQTTDNCFLVVNVNHY